SSLSVPPSDTIRAVPELQQAPAKKQRPRPSGDPSERDPWGETREGPRSGPLPQRSAPLAEPLRAHEDVHAVLARVAASLVLVAVVVHELQAVGMPGLQSEGAQIPTGLGGVALVEGLVAGRRRVRVAEPFAVRAGRDVAAVDPGVAPRIVLGLVPPFTTTCRTPRVRACSSLYQRATLSFRVAGTAMFAPVAGPTTLPPLVTTPNVRRTSLSLKGTLESAGAFPVG